VVEQFDAADPSVTDFGREAAGGSKGALVHGSFLPILERAP